MKGNRKNNIKLPLTLVFPIAYSWIASSLSISSQFLPFGFTVLLVGKTIILYLNLKIKKKNKNKKEKRWQICKNNSNLLRKSSNDNRTGQPWFLMYAISIIPLYFNCSRMSSSSNWFEILSWLGFMHLSIWD